MKFGGGIAASSTAGQTMQLVGAEDAFSAFNRFYSDDNIEDVLSAFDAVCEGLDLHPGRFPDWFRLLKARLSDKLSYTHVDLFKILEKKAKRPCYGFNKQCSDIKVLVVGAGPCGLRTAIECQLLGARTVVVEQKSAFSENNVMKLWKFALEDLKQLGVKRLYNRLGFGTIDHISCKVLQTALLKICCLLGVQVYTGVKFISLLEPEDELGWHARLEPEDHEARHFSFDVVVGATGVQHSLGGFNRLKEVGSEDVTVIANFNNESSSDESFITELPEIQEPVHRQFLKDMEKELKLGMNISNLLYYKDVVHHFRFETSTASLLKSGVLKEEFECRNRLLSSPNINQDRLQQIALEVAKFATRYFSRQLPHSNFAGDAQGNPDVGLYDFSHRFISQEASRVTVRKGFPLLITLVGDSLANLSWNDGVGTARGILSCLDAAWQIRSWSLQTNPLQVLGERQSLYGILAKVTEEGGLKSSHKKYSPDPRTRYHEYITPKIYITKNEEVIKQYDTDNTEEMRFLREKFLTRSFFEDLHYSSVVGSYRVWPDGQEEPSSGPSNWMRILKKKSARSKEKLLLKLGKTQRQSQPDEIDEDLTKFQNQNHEVRALHESVNDYVSALREVEKAESKLFATWGNNIQDWQNLENFLQNAETIKERRKRNVDQLCKDVVVPLKTYKFQFQEVKRRLDKLENLRMNYNRASWIVDQLQVSQSPEKEKLDAAIAAQSTYREAYKSLQNDLKEELPELYNVRQEFLATSLYSFFLQQNGFHNDVSFIYRDMCDYVLVKLRSN